MILLKHSKQELLTLAPYPVAAALSVLCPRGDLPVAVQHSRCHASTLYLPTLRTCYQRGQGTSEDRGNGGGVNLAVL